MATDDARIWIGGLPEGIQEDEIQEEFEKYGEVQSVQVRSNKGSPCFAFLQYRSQAEAEDAIAGADQARLFGMAFVKVSLAGQKRKGKGGRSRSRSRPRRDSPIKRRSRSRGSRGRAPPPWSQSGRASPRRPRSPPMRDDRNGGDRGNGGDRYRDWGDHGGDRGGNRGTDVRNKRPFTPPRRSSSRRGASRRRPPSRGGSPSRKGGGKGEQGKYRVFVENLPQDMGWQELKDVGMTFAKNGKCTFARTRRDCTGILEFTDYEDMSYAIKELNGRKFHGDSTRLVAYEDKS